MLAICTVVRNEASRWLPSLLPAWEEIADFIIAIDDGSTDATPELLSLSPKVVLHSRQSEHAMWGAEAPVRKLLWDLFMESDAEWGLWLDGDMVPANNPRRLFDTPADSIAFTLYDLWNLNPPLFRHDGYWKAHTGYRTWAVRKPPKDFEIGWLDRGIHCGHLPSNLALQRPLYAPPHMGLLHLAYSDADARATKHAQYMSQRHILGQNEYMHADSILDERPQLSPLPFPIEWKITKSS